MKSLDQRSKELDKKMEQVPLDEAVAILVRDAKTRRKQILALTISLTLDVILTIGLAALSIQANHTATEVQNSKKTLVANCELGNEFRTTEAALWNHLLSIEPVRSDYTPDQLKARDKIITEFRKYLDTTFAPRDCSNIIKK
jgi:hypothetical protein